MDNVASISILSLPLPMFLGDDTSFEGPIPTIFSNCPSDTLAALHNKLIQQKKGEFHKAVKNFLIMEYITLREAKEFVKKLRPSLGRPAFFNIPTAESDGQCLNALVMSWRILSLLDPAPHKIQVTGCEQLVLYVTASIES